MIILQQTAKMQCYTQANADWIQCGLDQIATAFGGAEVFGLLAGGMLLFVFYIASDSGLATPSAITTIIGGIMIPTLPPGFREMAVTIMVLGVVGAILAGANKFFMNPGV